MFNKSLIIPVILVTSLVSTPVFAQKIRDYTGSAESQYGTSGGLNIPGGPAVKSAPPQAAPVVQTEGGEKAEGEGQPTGTSVVQMYGGAQNANVPASTLNLKPEEMYRGVIPGTRDSVEHLDKKATSTSSNHLLWVGFQPRDTSTRVFFQTATEANYNAEYVGNEVVLTFFNTKFAAKNNSRFVDTSFFDRNVTRIESKKKGKDVEVRITLKEAERPQINTTDRFVYLEFTGPKNAKAEPAKQALDE